MIYSERLQVFLHAMDRPDEYEEDSADCGTGNPAAASDGQDTGGEGRPAMAYFESLRIRAREDDVPIIRREMESFLQVLLAMKKPSRILEVGAATGYSAMRMASFTPEDVKITTIEKDELRAQQARSNFEQSKWAGRIDLIEADAMEVLGSLESEAYDFIFMDAAKGQYLHFLPQILRVLKTEGILVSDNVLQDGMILQPRQAVEPRDRTIYERMRSYLRTLKRTGGLLTTIVPIGDGASVTVKTGETEDIIVT